MAGWAPPQQKHTAGRANVHGVWSDALGSTSSDSSAGGEAGIA